jgi:hypothetical protein
VQRAFAHRARIAPYFVPGIFSAHPRCSTRRWNKRLPIPLRSPRGYAGIRQVHAGKKCVPAEIAAWLAEHLGDRALSERAIQVLQQVATHHGQAERQRSHAVGDYRRPPRHHPTVGQPSTRGGLRRNSFARTFVFHRLRLQRTSSAVLVCSNFERQCFTCR